ncbi:MAG: hypothetical protein ACOC9Z_07650 [Chloroflexota bacterium]
MELLELYTHSFVIKIWLEETAEESDRARWRGHITHVDSKKRRHFQELEDILAFVWPYLQSMGVADRKVERFLKDLNSKSRLPNRPESNQALPGSRSDSD